MGSVTGKALLNRGFKVIAFIDERADEIKECLNLPVYTIEQFQKGFQKDLVIFVAVKNVYYHIAIVGNLNKAGFERIIYKSGSIIQGNANKREHILDTAYESIIKKGLVPSFSIPIVPYQKKLIWNKAKILDRCGDDIVVKMPAELLYTGKTDLEWTDVPILLLLPHISIFHFFGGDTRYSPEDYVLLCQKGAQNEELQITERWKKYVIKNRKDAYKNMRWKYEYEPEYFIKNAPEVELNSRGTFTLKTGKHRVSFMLSMGAVSIPVRIKETVWEKYYYSDKVQELKKILEKNQDLEIPIFHPCCQENIEYNCIFQQMMLRKILEMMYRMKILTGRKRCVEGVVDLTNTHGYFAHFFSGMGMKVYTPKKKLELDTTLDRVFNVEVSDIRELLDDRTIIIAEEIPTYNDFDIKEYMKGIFLLQSDDVQYISFDIDTKGGNLDAFK